LTALLRDRTAIIVLLGPALALYAAVMLVPIVWTLGYTLFEGSIIGGFTFVGTKNFETLLTDAEFHNALRFSMGYAIVSTVGQVGAGLLLALAFVFWLGRSSTLVRTVVFFPIVLPTVAVSALFVKLFAIAPQYGLLNATLEAAGLDALIQPWLGQPATAAAALVFMDVWRASGFYAIILFAGLVEVPTEVLDAARVDGARGLTMFRRVILPFLRPILFTAIIFALVGTLKVFDSVVALTRGGPGTATTPLTLYMFETAFKYLDYGYGSTIAVALAVLCLLVTLALFRFARGDVDR
jgi:raffinose/stachyose/melibiose transport system permease protein